MNRKFAALLYQIISASFCVIVVISNILSAKMVMLPWLAFSIPAGLIIYPFTFLICDLATEIFGAGKAKLMIYIALGMNLLSLGMIQIGLWLPSIGLEEQRAFQTVLGLSSLRIFSSLASYLISQVVAIQLYAAIKRWTGSKWLWIRNNGSTFASQLVDTVLIDLLFLSWGLGMPMAEVFPIMLFSYLYKAFFSLAYTPLFYLLVLLIRGKWQTALAKQRLIPVTSLEPKGTL